MTKVTPETLTEGQIKHARASFLIERETYENAMYDDTEAVAKVCRFINAKNRHEWMEKVTP